MVPERPPLEIASAVNKVFIMVSFECSAAWFGEVFGGTDADIHSAPTGAISLWGANLPWMIGATTLRTLIQPREGLSRLTGGRSTGHAESENAAHRARDHQFFVRANDANRGPAGVRGNRPRGLRIVRLIQHLRPGLDANPVFLICFGNGSKVLA